MRDVFVSCFLLYFYNSGLSVTLEHGGSVNWLAGKPQGLACLCLPRAGSSVWVLGI